MSEKGFCELVEERHERYAGYRYAINWNIEKILSAARSPARDGFLVQHVHLRSTAGWSGLESAEYSEAWSVTDGAYVDNASGSDYHDSFEYGVGHFDVFDAVAYSLGTRGSVEYATSVYWVPKGSEAHQLVSGWDRSVNQAGELTALAGPLPGALERHYVFDRPVFTHRWDLTSLQDQREVVLERLRCYVKSGDEQDRIEEALEAMGCSSCPEIYNYVVQELYKLPVS